ncbi:hypothetical protein ACFV06_35025 [Streptomyces sp. NPDC059618]|uniref:hypothetical protein n=1 Tax=Streptomyces sp. NPDC059618 TaxID=3346887 RepID=UPI0036A01D8A
MRLRTSHPLAPTALAPTALALCVTFTSAPAQAVDAGQDCVSADAHDFPIRTRVHGGPDTYRAGGDPGTWYIDLTNTTAHPCGAIHPVVVLVDEKRTLRPEQARLEFYDGERAHPVRFERSDEAENVGPFDDGFPGFTVAPGRTVTVKVRLALASGAAAPNSVVVNAAVVQKHDDDGAWVGESNAYRFRIEGAAADQDPGTDEDPDRNQDGTADTGTGASPAASAGPGTGPGTGARTGTDSGTTTGNATKPPSPDQLAMTGPGGPNRPALAALALALVALGAGLFALARRIRPRRR